MTAGESAPGMPRWVKASGVVFGVLVVVVVVLLLTGGGPGDHGPGRHSGEAERPAGTTTPGGAAERPGGHTGPPPGVDHGR